MNLGWFFTNLTYAEWVIICTLRHSINGSFKSQPTVNGLWALQKQGSCSPAHRRIQKAFLPRLQCDGNNRDQTNNSMFVSLPRCSLKVKRFLLKQQFLFHERWILNHKCVLISLLLLLFPGTLLLYSIMPHINFLINTYVRKTLKILINNICFCAFQPCTSVRRKCFYFVVSQGKEKQVERMSTCSQGSQHWADRIIIFCWIRT